MFFKILDFRNIDESILKGGVSAERLAYAATFSDGGLDGIAAEYCLNQLLEKYREEHSLPESFTLPAVILHDEKGRPEFKLSTETKLPCFSMSHSDSIVAAVVSEKSVGIDVEKIVAGREKIAPRFFTSAEVEWMNEGDRTLRFFKQWCVKESFLKASGKAGFISMKDCSIQFENDEKTANISLKNADNLYEAKILDAPEGFICAVCYEKN